jgi:hypothetical protein
VVLGREERWRSTSATFHDDLRKGRERHEAWIIQEMAWQRDMLIGLSHDMKNLQSLGHSMKWGKERCSNIRTGMWTNEIVRDPRKHATTSNST